jgi:hypothetical protein
LVVGTELLPELVLALAVFFEYGERGRGDFDLPWLLGLCALELQSSALFADLAGVGNRSHCVADGGGIAVAKHFYLGVGTRVVTRRPHQQSHDLGQAQTMRGEIPKLAGDPNSTTARAWDSRVRHAP